MKTSFVEKCNVNVNIEANNGQHVGGCLGEADGVTVLKTGTTGDIKFNSNDEVDSSIYIAGFIGGHSGVSRMTYFTYIFQCYSKNNLTITGTKGHISGFLGDTKSIKVCDSYYTGNLKYGEEESSGKIASFKYSMFDENDYIYNCYSNPVSVVGKISSNIEMNGGTFYYNKGIMQNEFKTRDGIIGLTQKEINTKDSYKALDFEKIWKWDDKVQMPRLLFEYEM